MAGYEALIEKIAESSGVAKEEIDKKVEAKRAMLSGLISREGAAQIIAAELGISFENQEFKISELVPGMKKVNLVAKVLNIFPVRSFERNGQENKVSNFIVADETGSTRCVLWDTNHIELIENKTIKEGDSVEVKNAGVRDGEIHLGSFSELKKSDKVLENIKRERSVEQKDIEELGQGQNVEVRGIVVQMFNPRFFSVCPECNKKAEQTGEGYNCKEHGSVVPKERAVMNFVLDDGTESVRVVLFSDQINQLTNEEELKDTDKLQAFREDLLGTEFYVSGNVRNNSFFNNLEIIANKVEKVDVDKLVADLEGKE